MCMMKEFKDFLQRNNDFGNSGARCEGEVNLLIDQSFANCKVNGGWTEWSVWSDCPDTCGDEDLTRTRSCTNPPPDNNGTVCQGHTLETISCTTAKCPVNGGWTEWSVWSDCPETCGDEYLTRTRSCTNPSPENNGTDCQGSNTETLLCSTAQCPVNGGWTEWSVWSDCPETCSDEDLIRTRSCSNPSPDNNGTACQGNTTETILCSTAKCPVNGKWTAWSVWSDCPETCGDEDLIRTRSCTNPSPGNNGTVCQGNTTETISCHTANCPGIMNAVVIILVSCGAGILPFFCIVYCCAHKKGKRANINRNVNYHGNHADRDEEISQNVLTEKESDEEYAEIDELEVSDLIVSPLEQRYFTDSDSSSDNESDEIKLSSFANSHPTLLHRDEEISQNVLTGKESDEECAEIDELEVSDLIVSPLEQRYFTDSDSSSENTSDEIKLSSFANSHPTLLHRDEEISHNVLTEKESDEECAEIDELEVSDLIVSPLEQRYFTDSDSSSENASDEIKLSSFCNSHPTLLHAPQQSGNVQGDSDAC
ncbi:uncharacterized protein LOC134692921 isoform X2 [Mytilus trossulus]|uniref:uncharacterized protein LOC134692921 isoform X2 n=1 Tax=Mytilus trossulus TaxID=6551 RepID=UPI00300456A2